MPSRFGVAARSLESERLDLALTRPPFSLSRREAKRVIADGRVALNGKLVAVESRHAAAGSRIALIDLAASVALVEERSDLLVVDKPVALPAQPSPDDPNPSLIELLSSMLRRRGEPSDTFVVHRLDTNTTGVMLVARTEIAAMKYSRLIAGGEAEKRYSAIVEGRMDDTMRIEAPIGRLQGNLFGVLSTGKPALSIVTPLSATAVASLLDVSIETGRTHQIRVHLAHAGHPVLGDVKYGHGASVGDARRPMLHSRLLRIGDSEWSAPLPRDFVECAARLSLAL